MADCTSRIQPSQCLGGSAYSTVDYRLLCPLPLLHNYIQLHTLYTQQEKFTVMVARDGNMCAEPVFVNVSGDQESISASLCAWRASTSNRVVVPARLAGNRFLSSWNVYKYGLCSLENPLWYPGREYWMSYGGPGFLVIVRFSSFTPPPPPPSPVSKFSLFLSFPVCRRRRGGRRRRSRIIRRRESLDLYETFNTLCILASAADYK